jgi:RNA polymerase sigma factor (sigma-70 family)
VIPSLGTRKSNRWRIATVRREMGPHCRPSRESAGRRTKSVLRDNNQSSPMQRFLKQDVSMPSRGSPLRERDQFHTTRWSLVVSAQGVSGGLTDGSTNARAALAQLCEFYWYPLYAFVRRQGYPPHDAQDLTQEFFARLLTRDWLANVHQERGRFRSWLLAAMKHFLANEWDRLRAQKRGGPDNVVSIDEAIAEGRYQNEPADAETPERLFDRRWALTLLERVLGQLRQQFAEEGKSAQFEILKETLTGESPPYAEIGAALQMNEGTVKVAVHRLRERYRALIRSEVAQTVATPAETDTELRHLLSSLGR